MFDGHWRHLSCQLATRLSAEIDQSIDSSIDKVDMSHAHMDGWMDGMVGRMDEYGMVGRMDGWLSI